VTLFIYYLFTKVEFLPTNLLGDLRKFRSLANETLSATKQTESQRLA
jgi:hypothetical protein